MPFTFKIPNILHPFLFRNGEGKQERKRNIKRLVSTPLVFPKSHSLTISHRERNFAIQQIISLLSYEFPKANTIIVSHLTRFPPTSSFLYFWLMTCFQSGILSLAKCQLHLQRWALFIVERHLTPKPPFFLFEQIIFHLTKWRFCISTLPPHKKSL